MSVIDGHPFLKRYKPVLASALKGSYRTVDEMKGDLLEIGRLARMQSSRQSRTARSSLASAPSQGLRHKRGTPQQQRLRSGRRKQRNSSKSGGVFETLLIVVSVLALYFAYIVLFFI